MKPISWPLFCIPDCYGPGDGVIAVDDARNAAKEFIHIQDLVQVLLALLNHAQDAQADEVVSENTGKKITQAMELAIQIYRKTRRANVQMAHINCKITKLV